MAVHRRYVVRAGSLASLVRLMGGLVVGVATFFLLTRMWTHVKSRSRTWAGSREEQAVAREMPGEAGMSDEEEALVEEEMGTETRKRVAIESDIVGNLEARLDDDALKGYHMLLDRGALRNMKDFADLVVTAYEQNDVEAMMSEGIEPHVSRVVDIIHGTSIAQDFFDSDIKRYLAPLFLAGFDAIHSRAGKKRTVKVT